MDEATIADVEVVNKIIREEYGATIPEHQEDTSVNGDSESDENSPKVLEAAAEEIPWVIKPDQINKLAYTSEDCFKVCSYFSKKIAERARIEQEYANDLLQWEGNWNNPLAHHPPTSTMRKALDSVKEECHKTFSTHLDISKNLFATSKSIADQVDKDISPTSSSGCRERKQIEKDFKNIQDSWSKTLKNVEKANVDYHARIKKYKNVYKKASDSATPKLVHARTEVTEAKQKYMIALENAKESRNKYIEEMMGQYKQCRELEKKMESAMKRSLYELLKCLLDGHEFKMRMVYNKLGDDARKVDVAEDVKNWEQQWRHEVAEVPKFYEKCAEDCICRDF